MAVAVEGTLSIRTRLHPVLRAAVATLIGIPATAATILMGLTPISIFGASIVLTIMSLALRRRVHQRPLAPSMSVAPPVPPHLYPLDPDIPKYPGSLNVPEESRLLGTPPDAYPQNAVDDDTHHGTARRIRSQARPQDSPVVAVSWRLSPTSAQWPSSSPPTTCRGGGWPLHSSSRPHCPAWSDSS